MTSADLAGLAHGLDAARRRCLAVIETPAGSAAKLNYDSEIRAFRLVHLLPAGMRFPLDFGFVPSTRAPDGDPLDVMVFADVPLPTGCVLEVRLIGVIEARQTKHGAVLRNDRLLAVAELSRAYGGLAKIDDLPPGLANELMQFWVDYNRARGETFEPIGLGGPTRAAALVASCGS